jgi:hypothetical protein
MLFDWENCVDVVAVANLITSIWFLCALVGWLICGMPWYTGTSEVRQFHPSVALSGFAGTTLSLWAYMCCCLLLVVLFWTIEWVVASVWYWNPSLCFCCMWVACCLLLVHIALVNLFPGFVSWTICWYLWPYHSEVIWAFEMRLLDCD